MPFTVCQRSIDMVIARDADRAVEAAKSLFERHEHVPNWFLHADTVEAEAMPAAAVRASSLRRGKAGDTVAEEPIVPVGKPGGRRRGGARRAATRKPEHA